MPFQDQAAIPGRYTLIPRTLIFVRRDDSFLLIRGSASKKTWPGLYNGIGGHVDRGEDILTAAHRELLEETGLHAHLLLSGTVIIDTGEVGVGLYVFRGEVLGGALRHSAEGVAEWIPIDSISSLPTVADVPAIIARLRTMKPGDPPFAARSFCDAAGELHLEFG